MVLSVVFLIIGFSWVIIGNYHATKVKNLNKEEIEQWEEEFGKIADSNVIINIGFGFILLGLLGLLFVGLRDF